MRNPIQLVKDSYGLLQGRWKLFGSVVLVPAVLAVIAGLFAFTSLEGILSLLLAVISMFMGIALILVISGREMEAKSAYKASLPLFWRYFAVSVLVAIAISLGLVLLIIPGIILAVWFAFANLVVILEGKGIIDSIKASKAYVKGKWWPVFGRLALLVVLVLLVSFVFGMIFPLASTAGVVISNVLGVLIAPYALAYLYLLYQDVKVGGLVMEKKTDDMTMSQSPNTKPLTEA